MRFSKLHLCSLLAVASVGLCTSAKATVVPADTFSIAVLGFNSAGTTGILLTDQLTATFGVSQTFVNAGLGGQTVTVSSSESIGATTTTDTFTISVPTNFIPAGTTVDGTTPVQLIEMDIGGYNAGTDPINFLLGITSPVYHGSTLYSGGTLDLSAGATANAMLGNGNTTLFSAEGVQAGGADLSPFAIRSFTFSVTYGNPIPEPGTFALCALGGIGLLVFAQRSRRRV